MQNLLNTLKVTSITFIILSVIAVMIEFWSDLSREYDDEVTYSIILIAIASTALYLVLKDSPRAKKNTN